jgi:hypothetical protein
LVTGWYVRVRENVPPEPIEAARPCPQCRGNAVQFTKPDLREITRQEYDGMRGKKCFATLLAEQLAQAYKSVPVPTQDPLTP